MLQHGATCSVSFTYVDRGGRKGKIKLFLPFATEASHALQFGYDMNDAFQPAIQASLIEIKVLYEWRESDIPVADPDSNIHRRLVLFYRNEQGFEAISIPSPKAECFQVDGPYAGIKVDAQMVALEPWVDALALVVGALATPEGEPFPTEYVVGGLAE